MTTSFSNKYYKSIPYVIKAIDTLELIRSQYPYISHWELLAEFNSLDYPYIGSSTFTTDGYAQGTVTFTRDDTYVGDLYIPENTIVSYQNYYFKTTEDALLAIDETSTSPIAIEAIESGDWYNVSSGTITTIDTPAIAAYATVINTASLTGGFRYNVAKPGDIIYIPTEDYFGITVQPKTTYATAYGIDIKAKDNLAKDYYGTLEEASSNNLVLVAGIENLSQAIVRKLTTPKGSLVKHPDYGSDLYSYIGVSQDYDLPELLKIETERTILSDSRVLSVEDINVTYHDNAALITCKIIAKSNDQIVFSVSLGQNYEGD